MTKMVRYGDRRKCSICGSGIDLTRHHLRKGHAIILCKKCHESIHRGDAVAKEVGVLDYRLICRSCFFRGRMEADVRRKLVRELSRKKGVKRDV